jgi:hypothetical protein
MSHHLDTPLARQDGPLFIDDPYVFPGQDSTVFVLDVNSTITEVHVRLGFHHEARYELKAHFEAAEFETLTYCVSFDVPEADGRQTVRVHVLREHPMTTRPPVPPFTRGQPAGRHRPIKDTLWVTGCGWRTALSIPGSARGTLLANGSDRRT